MTIYKYKELDAPPKYGVHLGGMFWLLEYITKAEKDGWELVSIDQKAITAIMRKPN